MPEPDFHADPRAPRSYIEEAADRAFREGFWSGGFAGALLATLVALIIYTL